MKDLETKGASPKEEREKYSANADEVTPGYSTENTVDQATDGAKQICKKCLKNVETMSEVSQSTAAAAGT